MEMIRGYRYRLEPTAAQAEAMASFCGVCRLVWNLALEQRRVFGRAHRISCHDQIRELKGLRAEFDWIAAVSQTAQTQTLMDLDRAFLNFFSGRASFPRFRRKDRGDAFRVMGREVAIRRLNRRWSEIRLPKIGWVRFRDSRPLEGTIRNVTVAREGDGWMISIACKVVRHTPGAPDDAEPIGIDLGVATALVLSNEVTYHLPASLDAIDRRHRRAQRAASRKTRGSNRHRRALRRAARLKARGGRIRRHWQHETTTDIARRYPMVAMEALKTRNMTRSAKGTVEAPGTGVRAKAGLNRSILNVGWHEIARQLAYKLEERGGEIVFVDPRYTSQTCAQCGAVDHQSRESQARFRCTTCGHAAHADVNAAKNILARAILPASEHGVDARARGSVGCPDDPRTSEPAASAA